MRRFESTVTVLGPAGSPGGSNSGPFRITFDAARPEDVYRDVERQLGIPISFIAYFDPQRNCFVALDNSVPFAALPIMLELMVYRAVAGIGGGGGGAGACVDAYACWGADAVGDDGGGGARGVGAFACVRGGGGDGGGGGGGGELAGRRTVVR
eukprot:PhM_4_TR4013/c0_g1_i1/m.1156